MRQTRTVAPPPPPLSPSAAARASRSQGAQDPTRDLLTVGGLVALEALIWPVTIALDALVAALCLAMSVGRLRRIAPQTTHNHEYDRGSRPSNRDITVKSAGPGGGFAAMTHDHGRRPGCVSDARRTWRDMRGYSASSRPRRRRLLTGKRRTRRAAEPSARSATGTPNAVQVFEKTERPWRCRDSNPSPPGPFQGFSERSLHCFSQPRRSRRQYADGLSHCLISQLFP